MLFDEQPVVTFFTWPPMHAHQVPAAAELFAIEGEREMALGQPFVWVVFRLPTATIPDHDCAAAIFTFRNGSFEFVVGIRMILNLHRQPLFAWYKTGASRHGPAFHHAVELKAKIIVQAPRRVLLDDKGIAARAPDLA